MKILGKWLTILGCLLLTVGCWDQRLMKNATLIQAVSLDQAQGGKILFGASIAVIGQAEPGSGQPPAKGETMFAIANTPGEGRLQIDLKVPGNLDPAKNKLILFGEPFARQGISPSLDVMYRDPRNSLGAKLAIVEGKAIELLRLQPKEESNIGDYLLSLLNSAEENSNIPAESVQTLASEMLDPGEDIVLPYLQVKEKEKAVALAGPALLNGGEYSGIYLPVEESILFLLLDNQKGKYASFTKRVSSKEKPDMNNFITINVKKIKRKLQVHVNRNREVTVNLNLHLKVHVAEYPKGDVDKEMEKLNKTLSNIFSKEAKQVTEKLQKANCDAFGIGRRLMAFHPDTWKETDQKEYFRNVKFSTTVNVDIAQVGISE